MKICVLLCAVVGECVIHLRAYCAERTIWHGLMIVVEVVQGRAMGGLLLSLFFSCFLFCAP